jgi:hypothetical protein
MARAESKQNLGFYATDPKHHAGILSLVAPATPAHRLLDPFAGEGAFLEVAAQAWNVTPYANELDGERAQQCIERFGPKQAVRCDVERLLASNGAFGAAWLNPPYDHSTVEKGSKRIEFVFLRHAWKWLQHGGLALWCVYRQHITEEAAAFLAKHSARVDVWALPGKHLGEYDQIARVEVESDPNDPERQVKKTTIRLKPDTTLTLLAEYPDRVCAWLHDNRVVLPGCEEEVAAQRRGSDSCPTHSRRSHEPESETVARPGFL